MKLLATFKHISSKNADYGAAEAYLTFEHDEFTMKPTLDENGRLVPREGYRLATLNCGEEDFAVACLRSNLRYGKNQKREDVKSHHYIISFDPRDGTDNGLTVDKAQSLGEEFCNEHFPGHQAIVCTHPDGHNHSGNIHVHIVINSLRIEAVPLLPYMDRPADTKDGCKHRCTDAAMEYFKSEVMEMCHRENLYQIDLLHGSKNRVTEREYWAQKKGQLEHMPENMRNIAIKEFGSIEQWKKHYMEVVSSEEMQKGYAKVVEWYGGKDKFLSVARTPVSKEVAESYNKRIEAILQKLIAKQNCDIDSFEVKELVGEYGFVMKQLAQIKEEKGFMMAQAQYYRNEQIKPMIDEKYGEGASDFFAQAIENYYKVK